MNVNTNTNPAVNANKTGIEAPWYHYQKALRELFKRDDKIHVREVVENEEAKEGCQYILNIDAYGKLKGQALQKTLPHIAEFGNVKMAINVIMHEENLDENPKAVYEALFAGNAIFSEVLTTVDFAGTEQYFISFKPNVIQFPDDNTADPYGMCTTLPQDVAKASFIGRPDIHFCTELVNLPDGTTVNKNILDPMCCCRA